MDKFLTTKQAADILGVTVAAVCWMVKEAKILPDRRFGRSYAFLRSEVNRAKKRRGPGRPRKTLRKTSKISLTP